MLVDIPTHASMSMASVSTRERLGMPLLYGMAGNKLIFQLNAPVERPFQLSMPCHELKELGFPTLRHNKVRDLTTSLLTEVCPPLNLTSN